MAPEGGFDEELRRRLEEDVDGLVEQLREAMTSTVRVKLVDEPCSKCGCLHMRYIEAPDYKTKLQIAEWWANRGFGRPGQQPDGDEGEKIVFQRLVDYGDES